MLKNPNSKIVVYIVFVLVGLVVLAWPEEKNLMMVQLSESHGPSMLDSVGLAIIFLGYVPMVIKVFRNFPTILSHIGRKNAIVLIAVIAISGAFIPIALINGSDMLLWISVAVCTIAEGILIFFAFRRSA